MDPSLNPQSQNVHVEIVNEDEAGIPFLAPLLNAFLLKDYTGLK